MPKWYGGSNLNPDETVSPEDQWKLQFYRVGRWYDRVLSLKSKSETEKLTDYDFDTLIAFFQNCYHLRDWLESARPVLRDQIKVLFEQNFELRMCRDICHGFKHKRLNNPSIDPDFNLYREYDPFKAEVKPDKNPEVYNIAFANGNDIRKFNVFDFVDKCIDIWNEFLKNHGLVHGVDTSLDV
jgi:hypothetical protein